VIFLAGVILILAAFYAGIPPQIHFDDPAIGHPLLIIGVSIVTWQIFKRLKHRIDHVPLIIGAFVLGYIGLYHQSTIAAIGGVAIILAWTRVVIAQNYRSKDTLH